jgi:Protein of unknown function (DUF2946)
MGWFRSRSRLGSWLALFALAFQLAVSFGHVHLDGVRGFGHPPVVASVPAAIDATAALDPAGKDKPALADDYCAVCALIHLAGALVPAEVPSLPLPNFLGRLPLAAAIDFDLTQPRRARFQARAPPIA